MPNPTRWSIPNRILAGALILYSALLCGVSLHVFYTAVHQGSSLNAAALSVQALAMAFPLLLLLGLWKPRVISALLFVGGILNLALTLTAGRNTADAVTGLIGASLLFLGVPMLGAAIFFHRISRHSSPASK
jgi:hypothetical protein